MFSLRHRFARNVFDVLDTALQTHHINTHRFVFAYRTSCSNACPCGPRVNTWLNCISESRAHTRARGWRRLDMGATGWRTAHNPVNSEILDFCDRKGMLVWSENRSIHNHNHHCTAPTTTHVYAHARAHTHTHTCTLLPLSIVIVSSPLPPPPSPPPHHHTHTHVPRTQQALLPAHNSHHHLRPTTPPPGTSSVR
jgi:hypothetical protein